MKQKQTFSGIMQQFGSAYDPSTAFDDFLSILLAGFAITNWQPGDALPYRPFLDKYDVETQQLFPRLIKVFADEFEQRRNDNDVCPDVLGEYYELHFSKKPPHFFLPWSVCKELVLDFRKVFGVEHDHSPVMSHTCGSGRILVAVLDQFGFDRPYYGADTDVVCTKITAIQLFMAGVGEGEAVCGNPLLGPDNFVAGWKIMREPHGVFPIASAEESAAWKIHVRDVMSEPLSTETDEHGGILLDGLYIRFEA